MTATMMQEAAESWLEQSSEPEWRDLADEQQDTLPCRAGMHHEWKATCRTYSGYGYRREVALELGDWFTPADQGTHGKTFTCAHCRQSVFVGTSRLGRTVANVSPYAGRNAKEARRETVPPTFAFKPNTQFLRWMEASATTANDPAGKLLRKLGIDPAALTIHDTEG